MRRFILTVLALTVSLSFARAEYKESGLLAASSATQCKRIANFCVLPNGNLAVCDTMDKALKVIAPDDTLVATWALGFAPEAVCPGPDGTVYAAGSGKVAWLDAAGKAKRTLIAPNLETGGGTITGITCSGNDVYVAGRDKLGYAVFRMTGDLMQPEKIIDSLRGCCGQMDIRASGEHLFIAENARFQVHQCDRTGKKLASWGSGDRKKPEAFGGCCNPMNLCFDAQGNVLTSESEGIVKTFTAGGEFKETTGRVGQPSGCKRVTLDLSPDGNRIYVLDTGKNRIYVMTKS